VDGLIVFTVPLQLFGHILPAHEDRFAYLAQGRLTLLPC
jgi:hypothetical protein